VDFAQQQRRPTKHLVGLGVVLVLHVLVGWALVDGLARKVVEVVKAPIETKLVEEVKPPPPPPKNLPPPPTKLPPPPAFVPPPEVVVTPPPVAQAPITSTPIPPSSAPVTNPGAEPQGDAPPAAGPVVVAPKVNFQTDCALPVYPREARLERATGETLLRVAVAADGQVTEVEVLRSSGPSRAHKQMDRALVSTVRQTCKFQPGTVDGRPQPLSREVIFTWKLVD
jgi:protein TonB